MGASAVEAHTALAAGPHVCLGMHLARLEAHTALGLVLDRLDGLELDPERPSSPQGLVFRKPPQLRVVWDAANANASSRPRGRPR